MAYLQALGPPEDCTAEVPFVRAPIWFRPREAILAQMKVTFNKDHPVRKVTFDRTAERTFRRARESPVNLRKMTGIGPPGLFVWPRETISSMWDTSFRRPRVKVTFNKDHPVRKVTFDRTAERTFRRARESPVNLRKVTGIGPPGLFVWPRETISSMWDTSFRRPRVKVAFNRDHPVRKVAFDRENLWKATGIGPPAQMKVTFNKALGSILPMRSDSYQIL
jgi:predicted flap endonuclease-1-like 5' DNA nuclease